MRKRVTSLLILLLCLMLVLPAFASGILMAEDLTGTAVYPYDPEYPDGPAFTYAWCYPCIDPSESCAAVINAFYEYEITDANEFANPITADDLFSRGVTTPSNSTVSYELTCNNGEYISFCFITESEIDGFHDKIWSAHTFSATDPNGTTVNLPKLLGLLSTEEVNDDWLADRQTRKAEELVRELVWEQIESLDDDGLIELFSDMDEEYFAMIFWPEDDFWLDKNGDPVFFIQPGRVTDESYGLLTFPIPLETLTDEF